LNALIDLQPRQPGLQPRQPGRDVAEPGAETLRSLIPLVRPGSVVIALSDFHSPGLQSQEQWSTLAAHSDCRWLWITDPLEERALPKGRFLAGFGGKVAPVDGASVRSAWLATWAQRAARITELTSALRIGLLRLDTAQNVADALHATLGSAKSAA
jgi:hypothetical protein